MEIKDILKNRRVELGLTMLEVAKAVGVSEGTVSRWESGNIANMGRSKINMLAKILKLNPGTIVGYENEGTEKNHSEIIEPTAMLPIYGKIAAGIPIFAEENIEGYYPALVKNPKEHFYLRVKGESMIGAGIKNGSLVLIHKQNTAVDNQIVACRVNGDEYTLKRFSETNDVVVLLSENPAMSPILVPKQQFDMGYAEIVGVVRQILIDV